MEKLSLNIPDKITNILVSAINRMDEIKLILKDGGWLLIRPSGTEPLSRIYGESTNKDKLQAILQHEKKLVIEAMNK